MKKLGQVDIAQDHFQSHPGPSKREENLEKRKLPNQQISGHACTWICNTTANERWGQESSADSGDGYAVPGQNGVRVCLPQEQILFVHDGSEDGGTLRMRNRGRASPQGRAEGQRMGQGESRRSREVGEGSLAHPRKQGFGHLAVRRPRPSEVGS